MQINEINLYDVFNGTGKGIFQLTRVAILVYSRADAQSLKVLKKMTDTLYYWNPEVYTILVGTHKDKPRQVLYQDIDDFKDHYFIDYTFEITTQDTGGINECEAALKLAGALVSKIIVEAQNKREGGGTGAGKPLSFPLVDDSMVT